MVGGTAPAVTVQINSGVTVLFTDSADVGRWQNWCAVFTIILLLRPLHPGSVSLLLAGRHSLTHSHAHIPRSAVAVSYDVLMLQAFTSPLHTSLK